ncbi:MAG: hypothetical protein IAE82_20255 [Opitutaceae bacterium]|nr:hypothetical protein [Opitutaceae bacterium]
MTRMCASFLALFAALVIGGKPCAAQPWTDDELLEDLERRTFLWFWETTDPANGLAPDRGPPASFSSVAAVGFALTAYPIGVERAWITRVQAAARTRTTLQFLRDLPQGPAVSGTGGYRGFFYHFIDLQTGLRVASDVELSSIDTAWLMMGVLFCQTYFDGGDADEVAIRALADDLYRRVEWDWMVVRAPRLCMGWSPSGGFLPHDYTGYNEAMALYLLALGSPTHSISDAAWASYTGTYAWADFRGQEHVNFGPLFGHQYSHAWIDFRGIADAFMRGRGIDYHENSRRAAYAQRAYAIANPGGWSDYGADIWGLTACDGPADVSLTLGGRLRRFHAYTARGAASNYLVDDGTIAPTAAASSIAFAPEIAIPAIRAMRVHYGDAVYGTHGFVDAFNPTFTATNVVLAGGRVVAGLGWFDTQHLGIDQGPILLLLENHRSGLVWRVMQRSPYIVSGLQRAGFTGGWLAAAPTIVAAPANTAADVGGSFSLSVEASGLGPLTYQWLKDGQPVAGATGRSYVAAAAVAGDAGTYAVRVTNANGTTESASATVQIHATAAQLVNLSTRGHVGTGDAALIPGCGAAGARAKPVVMRVVGPTLARFQLDPATLLADPRLAVRPLGGSDLAASDDWGSQADAAEVDAAMRAAGAFALPAESKDAALLFDVVPGTMVTMVSTGAGSVTGLALAEIYARDDAADARLVNLSTRGFVGTGNAVMIPGFYLNAGGTRRLLLRAVGPSLARVAPGLGPLLADPILIVRRAPAGTEVMSNDDWSVGQDGAAVAAAAAQVGAFALLADSKDAAAILVVGPSVTGSDDRGYTIEVRGADGGTGIALAEIYEMPAERE